ncbi:hypothetical protein P3594_18460 [Vibrio parahaemolyticus]|uniref:hypothetical protein n=1 Tax=Vibrio parahaemolyticus TaxID=670 RepID=UPI001E3B20C7|nr:hypothetical protein [Vibrio parahaemolyticus]EKO4254934.1 hypothetical protein [Vibrio parahaemolyticus]MDF5082276.1 hypothetical protein [Vibrio parahaemolyticus]MDF5102123.1 hypothetical protein [Vibrio parahaemolyticus]
MKELFLQSLAEAKRQSEANKIANREFSCTLDELNSSISEYVGIEGIQLIRSPQLEEQSKDPYQLVSSLAANMGRHVRKYTGWYECSLSDGRNGSKNETSKPLFLYKKSDNVYPIMIKSRDNSWSCYDQESVANTLAEIVADPHTFNIIVRFAQKITDPTDKP